MMTLSEAALEHLRAHLQGSLEVPLIERAAPTNLRNSLIDRGLLEFRIFTGTLLRRPYIGRSHITAAGRALLRHQMPWEIEGMSRTVWYRRRQRNARIQAAAKAQAEAMPEQPIDVSRQ